LFTDGACSGNPGPGGWAFLLVHPATGKRLERSGGERETTNNRMEMQACIEALSAIQLASTAILVRTDSQYLIKCCSLWLPGWKARGWRRKDGPLANIELLEQLDELQTRHRVRWEWVRGHAGDRGNEHADRLANAAMDRIARGRDPHDERRFEWTAPAGATRG
ncbi:MAG TPA: ribonuclease HI, partial [Nannocystaceae bacterium]|nr:ribonuclease HI [Nannocystaceae bacterium]